MRPYYQSEGITIYHADFRDVDPALLAGVEAIITDPPYGETSLDWDVWPAGWPALAQRLAPVLWCFGSLRMFMEHAAEFATWIHSQEIVWEKHNGSALHNDRFRKVHELAALFYTGAWNDIYKNPVMGPSTDVREYTLRRSSKPAHFGAIATGGNYSYNGTRQMRSIIPARSCNGHAVNETQKPEAIIAPLMQYSVPPGGLVLDLFMGSGTTLVEAKRTGRYAIGIEKREAQCAAAVARLAQEFLDLNPRPTIK